MRKFISKSWLRYLPPKTPRKLHNILRDTFRPDGIALEKQYKTPNQRGSLRPEMRTRWLGGGRRHPSPPRLVVPLDSPVESVGHRLPAPSLTPMAAPRSSEMTNFVSVDITEMDEAPSPGGGALHTAFLYTFFYTPSNFRSTFFFFFPLAFPLPHSLSSTS